jgi:hypothetical protein
MAASKVWAPTRRRPSYDVAGEAAPSTSFESSPGGTRFVVSQTSAGYPQSAVNGSLRCRGYLQNRFLQFLHINRFGEMSGKAGAAASLHVLLHPITADGDAFGIADL